MSRLLFWVSFSSILLLGVRQSFADQAQRPFECRFTREPVVIDGQLNEPVWAEAEIIDRFTLPWLRANERPAKTATKARLLWDRDYFYFSAEMQDSDLYADVTDRDGETWHNDVFEVFLKPAVDKPGYYEFQVNAAGTLMDMFVPQRGAGGFRRFIKDADFHWEVKVTRKGTLNRWQDRDEGWTVEGRIPWVDFGRTGGRPDADEIWHMALCRYDYSIEFDGPELSTCAPLKSKSSPDFHHHEDYAPVRFVTGNAPPGKLTGKLPGNAPAQPERLKRLKEHWKTVPSRVVGSPEPPAPYRVARVLPQLKVSHPIFVANEPGSRRLIFAEQSRANVPTRLCRTTDDPASGEFTPLVEIEGKGVAYDICFHPQFEQNGFAYVGLSLETPEAKKVCRVVRYTIGRQAPHEFDVKSAKVILEWESNGHNGAAVSFGTDGMLYVTTGDGTSDSDTNLTGQGLDHLLAKLLRIDVDHPDAGREYSVPKDNPFVAMQDVRPETYALGFRNPWRLHIDQKSGRIWVGNNGQDLWEQVYLVQRGANYGWSVYEGGHLFYANRKLAPVPVSKPIFDHPHSESRSLTGGVTYYGQKHPDLHGAYIYGDHSTGKIWGAKLAPDNSVIWHKELTDSTLHITGFAIDSDGELLIADHRGNNEGGFYTLEPNVVPSAKPIEFPRTLSASGLFESVKGHREHPGLMPFGVNSPLWSDGAIKARFMYLPATTVTEGKESPTKIEFTQTRGWNLPDSTVLVKSFSLELEEGNAASRRWIETRFLTKQEGEWFGYSYHWNDEQTDAVLVPTGGENRAFTIREKNGQTRQQEWRFPSRAECMVCHSRAANYVLGPSLQQFNHDFDYDGRVANQLEVLEWLGVLRSHYGREIAAVWKDQEKARGVSEAVIAKQLKSFTDTRDQRVAGEQTLLTKPLKGLAKLANPYDSSAELEPRVRAYLHANCAHCHIEAGGGNAQMKLDFNTSLDKTQIVDVVPLHHRFEITDAKLVAPGQPDKSVMLTRISRRGTNTGQMPQLASSRVDEAAVKLLREWIKSLPDKKPAAANAK